MESSRQGRLGLIGALIRGGHLVFGGPATMPTRSLERLREAAILEASLEGEGFVPCVGHGNTGPHAAQWYSRCPCGHAPMPVCDGRKNMAERADGWECAGGIGCGTFHTFHQLEFTRI